MFSKIAFSIFPTSRILFFTKKFDLYFSSVFKLLSTILVKSRSLFLVIELGYTVAQRDFVLEIISSKSAPFIYTEAQIKNIIEYYAVRNADKLCPVFALLLRLWAKKMKRER